ncbi:MAG: response regulator [Pseudomonadota bacterium]
MTETISTAMLVDDEEIDQKMYRRIIQRSEIVENVHVFKYADTALDFLKDGEVDNVDVIFLDINMPRMNGFEFLEAATRELGEDFAKIVIVMLTTSLDPKDRARAAEFEVVRDFINKPLTIDHVRHAAMLLREHNAGL